VGSVGCSYGMTGLGGLWFRGTYNIVPHARFTSTGDTVSFLLAMDYNEILVFKNFEFLHDINIEGKNSKRLLI
jgi:hypothetical protein